MSNRSHHRPDPIREQAYQELKTFFDNHHDRVFYFRQLEVIHENKYFHWVTHHAIHDLIDEGHIKAEGHALGYNTTITLLWHHKYRYYKREASKVVSLVNEYSDPNIGAALGLHGETMVLEGFARLQFIMKGRSTNKYNGLTWTKTNHNLDFIFEKDSIAYGIEVKNTLGYMERDELNIKLKMCSDLALKPVIVARMLPRHWINMIKTKGGFALIMKYQLYAWTHKELAKRVAKQLDLPVDAPKYIWESTMKRFEDWHLKNIPKNT